MGRMIDQLAVGDKVPNDLGGVSTLSAINGAVIITSTGLYWGWDGKQLVTIGDNDQEPTENENKQIFDYHRLGEQLHRWGANVTAIRPNSKQPITSWKELQERQQTADELEALPWAMAGGVGIVNGSGGFRCIDIDARKGRTVPAAYKNEWLQALGLPADYPWCYRSGSGRGWHIWTHCPAGDISGVVRLKPIEAPEVDHIELRWTTGQTVINLVALPGEPAGEVPLSAVYSAVKALTVPQSRDDPRVENLPATTEKTAANGQSIVIAQMGAHTEKPSPAVIARALSFIPERSDYNHEWLRILMAVHSEYPNSTGVRLIEDWAPGHDGEVAAKFRSFERTAKDGVGIGTLFKIAKDYGWQPKSDVDLVTRWPAPLAEGRNLTDLGNAELFIDQHGAGLRYVPAWDYWYIYTGRHWRRDDRNEVNYLARETVRAIYAGAAAEEDEAERKKLASHALRSESRGKQRAMIDLAKDDPRATIDHAQLDGDPWLLNVLNGTVDLRTAELLPHDPDNLITRLIAVPYEPGAAAPHWLAFLDRVLDGNTELVTYLQRAIGYSLTGVTWEQCLFFLYGNGRNGKSTFSDVLLSLFSDYGARTQAETLLVKNYGSGASNDLARLPGARFVVASEVEEGRSLAESLVKDVTGGDVITARFLYQEHFQFRPQFKLWMYGNHKPNIRGTDDGIWRRMRLVPFSVQIPKEEVDRRLADKLRAELPGILAWAVQGCLEWQERGDLGEPVAVLDATAEYRTEQDVLAEFLDICTERATGSVVKAQEMHSAYAGWAEENGEKVNSARWLGFRLRDRGFANMRDRGGYHWQNVRLSEEGERLREAHQIKRGIM